MLSLRQRGYAIFKSLYFGILPSWFYEKHCHYSDNGEGMNIKTYLQHLWLKEQWSFESDVEDQDELGAYFSDQHSMHGVQYMLFYQVHDLIGETSHKTGKLVIKER